MEFGSFAGIAALCGFAAFIGYLFGKNQKGGGGGSLPGPGDNKQQR